MILTQAQRLRVAWDAYVRSFGEPPRGTDKQLAALAVFMPSPNEIDAVDIFETAYQKRFEETSKTEPTVSRLAGVKALLAELKK